MLGQAAAMFVSLAASVATKIPAGFLALTLGQLGSVAGTSISLLGRNLGGAFLVLKVIFDSILILRLLHSWGAVEVTVHAGPIAHRVRLVRLFGAAGTAMPRRQWYGTCFTMFS